MPRRLPACDPCRTSKLSCGHEKPVCSRCKTGDIADRCVYRARPFKKRKTQVAQDECSTTPQGALPSATVLAVSDYDPTKSRSYPNPGYLGSSSHTTFFDHLTNNNPPNVATIWHGPHDQCSDNNSTVPEDQIDQGALFLNQIQNTVQLGACTSLVEAWAERGINLPIAEPFTLSCANVACRTINRCDTKFMQSPADYQTTRRTAEQLFSYSCQPLNLQADDDIEKLCGFFCRAYARWETLGLFFTTVSRATIDIAYYDQLYSSEQERRALRRIAMRFSDLCLDIALSLDCLNDLQLILQYENFILHSLVDGDQSYHSWRKLGDVISSLFALGYHEQLGDPTTTPSFLRDLRFATFSRTYSADKNCSIFLGRPPRMLKRYCPTIDIPETWNHEECFSYRADTRMHGICASLKEDALDIQKDGQITRAQKADHIRHKAEMAWDAVPVGLKLDRPLSAYNRRHVELDFLVSARLNYEHVKFLLELTLAPRVSNPGVELLRISSDILSLVIEAVVLKDRLANSGTSLVWKVAYYGLAAAGVLSLALLYNTLDRAAPDVTPSRCIRDLSVLVAEVENGALLQSEDPNYALLSAAAGTIKNLLDRLISNRFSIQPDTQLRIEPVEHFAAEPTNDELSGWEVHGLQDFDPEFWLNLSEHPFLMTPVAQPG